MKKFERWRLVYLLHFLPLLVALAVIANAAQSQKPQPPTPVQALALALLDAQRQEQKLDAQKPKSHPVIPVLDCRESWVQAGVRVRRLTDQRVTRIDVCGAADSADDSFRDIPYEAPQ